MQQQTLSIIKPDGTKRNLIGNIVKIFEENNLTIAAMKKVWLSTKEAQEFYAVHKERPFFGELVEFISSAPVVVMVLSGENAILKNRDLMGATNPDEANAGTIRKLYSKSIGENTVHGSDSEETAKEEISYFFARSEIFN